MPRPKQSKPTKTSNPWDALDYILNKTNEPIGAEWFSVYDYANAKQIPLENTGRFLKAQTRLGRLERWIGFSKTKRRILSKYRTIK